MGLDFSAPKCQCQCHDAIRKVAKALAATSKDLDTTSNEIKASMDNMKREMALLRERIETLEIRGQQEAQEVDQIQDKFDLIAKVFKGANPQG